DRLDARVVLSNARAAGKPGSAVVAGACVDLRKAVAHATRMSTGEEPIIATRAVDVVSAGSSPAPEKENPAVGAPGQTLLLSEFTVSSMRPGCWSFPYRS